MQELCLVNSEFNIVSVNHTYFELGICITLIDEGANIQTYTTFERVGVIVHKSSSKHIEFCDIGQFIGTKCIFENSNVYINVYMSYQ